MVYVVQRSLWTTETIRFCFSWAKTTLTCVNDTAWQTVRTSDFEVYPARAERFTCIIMTCISLRVRILRLRWLTHTHTHTLSCIQGMTYKCQITYYSIIQYTRSFPHAFSVRHSCNWVRWFSLHINPQPDTLSGIREEQFHFHPTTFKFELWFVIFYIVLLLLLLYDE